MEKFLDKDSEVLHFADLFGEYMAIDLEDLNDKNLF